MPRPILDEAHIHPAIRDKIAGHHQAIVEEVRSAVERNDLVVVGMAMNPFPVKARKALVAAGVAHRYLEYGNYLNDWRRRNALKMWTGWPTFPDGVRQGHAGRRRERTAGTDRQRRVEADARALSGRIAATIGVAASEPTRMPESTIDTGTYKLFPSPRNAHRTVFLHEVFVPHPYALIDLPSFRFKGRYSLFAAYRIADGKHGQLVTFELEAEAQRFERQFSPD